MSARNYNSPSEGGNNMGVIVGAMGIAVAAYAVWEASKNKAAIADIKPVVNLDLDGTGSDTTLSSLMSFEVFNIPDRVAEFDTGISVTEFSCIPAGWFGRYDTEETGTRPGGFFLFNKDGNWHIYINMNADTDEGRTYKCRVMKVPVSIVAEANSSGTLYY